jgi:hypothetical protein
VVGFRAPSAIRRLRHQVEERIYQGIDSLGRAPGASQLLAIIGAGCEACYAGAQVEPVAGRVWNACDHGEPDRAILEV